MAEGSWKSMLKAQHADLEKLEAMDAELNDEKIAADIEKALKKTKLGSYALNNNMRSSSNYSNKDKEDDEDEEMNSKSRPPPPVPVSRPLSASSNRRDVNFARSSSLREDKDDRFPISPKGHQSYRERGERGEREKPDPDYQNDQEGLNESPGGPGTPKAPDATARYQKAKLKVLTKQVEDGQELRKQLNESVNDLQRQLKNEREENKKSKKRIQLLEVETKRNSSRRMSEADANQAVDSVETLTQEVAMLKKDLLTAERIAKQSEVIAKAKETHLKRALETISRLKAQVTELSQNVQNDTIGERSQLDTSEARVKLLERQRADLISAFKKQMKLIDVLKRQKVHIEAARLLSFTEDEFVRTLDWGA